MAVSLACLEAAVASRRDTGLASRLENMVQGLVALRLVATTRHSDMAVSAENALSVAPVAAIDNDMDIAVVLFKHGPCPAPGLASD